MSTFFLVCAVIGGGLLLVQLVLGVLGLAHDSHDVVVGHHHEFSQGLNLLSVRSLAAGAGFFGIAGLGLAARGVPLWATLPVAAAVGGTAMVGVAYAMRAMLRMEDDGTVQVQQAVGLPAQVYVRIPGARAGAGKVLMTLQNRTVELQAITAEGDLPSGTDVTVVDVIGPDTVEVVITPTMGELLDGSV